MDLNTISHRQVVQTHELVGLPTRDAGVTFAADQLADAHGPGCTGRFRFHPDDERSHLRANRCHAWSWGLEGTMQAHRRSGTSTAVPGRRRAPRAGCGMEAPVESGGGAKKAVLYKDVMEQAFGGIGSALRGITCNASALHLGPRSHLMIGFRSPKSHLLLHPLQTVAFLQAEKVDMLERPRAARVPKECI